MARFSRLVLIASVLGASASAPVAAKEVFVGAYVHEVGTPLTFAVNESGVDIEIGYRMDPVEALAFLGKPQPYLLASLNTVGDTSFAGGGLSWKLGKGPVYVRPGIGLIIHDGPAFRVDQASGTRTDLGSRVLFEPEIAIGVRLSQRVSLEASWVHISQAQIFNSQQNPGIDMMGARVNWKM